MATNFYGLDDRTVDYLSSVLYDASQSSQPEAPSTPKNDTETEDDTPTQKDKIKDSDRKSDLEIEEILSGSETPAQLTRFDSGSKTPEIQQDFPLSPPPPLMFSSAAPSIKLPPSPKYRATSPDISNMELVYEASPSDELRPLKWRSSSDEKGPLQGPPQVDPILQFEEAATTPPVAQKPAQPQPSAAPQFGASAGDMMVIDTSPKRGVKRPFDETQAKIQKEDLNKSKKQNGKETGKKTEKVKVNAKSTGNSKTEDGEKVQARPSKRGRHR